MSRNIHLLGKVPLMTNRFFVHCSALIGRLVLQKMIVIVGNSTNQVITKHIDKSVKIERTNKYCAQLTKYEKCTNSFKSRFLSRRNLTFNYLNNK